jgi:serine/threonine-protein kinase
MEDLSGQQFDRYQIIQPLGEGGMAAVYKAYQPSMDRMVALKVLPRQFATLPDFVARFQQEVRVLARLQHPHILPVFDYGVSNGYSYIVMPYIEAGTVATLLRGQPLPMPQVLSIISQVGEALDYAHTRGLLHRDVKPSNILINERGDCLLGDFGLAKILEATTPLTQSGGVLGTPAYMSPEQGSGLPMDRHTDIYSLGIVLYEMVTGRVPFQAETPVAVIFKHVHEALPAPRSYNPTLAPQVEFVIRKALAKLPADRYDTAGDMAIALRNAQAGNAPQETPKTVRFTTVAPSTVVDPTVSTAQPDHARRARLFLISLLALGAIMLICIVAIGSVWLQGRVAADALSSGQTATAGLQATRQAPVLVAVTSTATQAPTLAPLPSLTSSTQPTQLPTVPETPSSTAIPTTATPACPPVTGTFAGPWSQVQGRIGCSTGTLARGQIVEEDFQQGKMLWRQALDYGQAIVVFNSGTWAIYQHAPYVDGSPEYARVDANTPAQSPPTPRRGFGVMWCDIPAIRTGLGIATDVELGFTGPMQSFARGFMVGTYANAVLVFYKNGTWERR